MKKNKISIRLNILAYFIAFAVIILVIIWFTQIIFLNTTYEIDKTNTLKTSVETIKNAYNSDDYDAIFEQFSHNDICIEIVENEITIYSSSYYNKKCLGKNSPSYIKFKEDVIVNTLQSSNMEIVNPNFNNKTLVYASKIDDTTYAFVNASLIPLDDSVTLLVEQFKYIALLVLGIAIIMALFVSKHLSKPIVKLTNGAKKLKNKDFSVKFDGDTNYIEINELSDTLNSAAEELAVTDELRRDLMANVSHDLKTPLTMIKAYAEATRDLNGNNKEKRDEALNIIIDESERLNILVEDILNLSKLESISEEDSFTTFDITELIRNILKRYSILEEEGYKFIFNCKEKYEVESDIKRIEQVIYNLVNNAVNYTGKDNKVEVNITKLDSKRIRISIIDTGKGIKKEDMNLIWDKYYKNKKKHKRNKFGTGLGLSIVKSIFIKYNLNYGVTSSNKGTTFYFDIEYKNKKKK